MAVDVGGSGLRLQTCAVSPGPVLTAPGVRVGAGGIDVAALVSDARALLGARPDDEARRGTAAPAVVVWSVGLVVVIARPEKKYPTPSKGRGVSRVLRFLIFLEARCLVSDLAPAFRRYPEPVAVASQGRSLRHSG